MTQLTNEHAFKAMVTFLEGYYERTKSDDIGSLLGDLILLDDGRTADPAAWHDWLECVRSSMAKGGGLPPLRDDTR